MLHGIPVGRGQGAGAVMAGFQRFPGVGGKRGTFWAPISTPTRTALLAFSLNAEGVCKTVLEDGLYA